MSQADCPICLQPLLEDICVVDCSAMHAFHFACISSSITSFKKACPLDRQNIAKCLHEGSAKNLPDAPPIEALIEELERNEGEEE